MQSAEDGAMAIIMGMVDPNAKSGVLYGPKNNRSREEYTALIVLPPFLCQLLTKL